MDKVIVAELTNTNNSNLSLKAYTLAGKLLWNISTKVAYSNSPGGYGNNDNIIGDDKDIYIGLKENVYKLNSKTGELIFKTDTSADSGFYLSDRVLYGTWGSRLSAIDADTGKILWQYDELNLKGLLQSPSVSDKIYLTNSTGEAKDWLFAISKEGKEIWRKAISNKNNYPIALDQIPALISGGVAVVGEGALLAFDDRGNERWRSPMDPRSRSNSAASKDGLVYVTAKVPRYAYWQSYINPFRR